MDDELPSLIEFVNEQPTEDHCWNHLREKRWGKDGFTCPDCGEDEHWASSGPETCSSATTVGNRPV